jgi:hypothetical protein
VELARCSPGGVGQEHLAAGRDPGYSRGDVDGGSEPVTVPLKRGSGVHAHPHRRKAVPAADVMDNRKSKPYGGHRVAAMDHQRIADRLDLARLMCGQQGAHRGRELGYDIRRLLVPVGLGQCREAGQICEQKRVFHHVGLAP